MSVFTPTGGSSNVTVTDLVLSGTPAVSKKTMPGTVDTEDSIIFASTTKWFRIRARDNSRLRISYTASGSADGWTITAGNIYHPPAMLKLSGSLTLYIQSNKAGTEVEIETWS